MKSLIAIILLISLSTSAFAQSRGSVSFKKLDKNGDSKLARDELKMENMFDRLDSDNDGFVNQSELDGYAAKRVGKGKVATPAVEPNNQFPARPHGEEAAKAGLNANVLGRLDASMQKAIADKEVSGVISLIHRNGHRAYYEAFGYQELESQKPLAKDAISRLQSMTKPVVAVTALTLFEEGKFALDEPIAKHCPEWTAPNVLENSRLVPAKFAITPRMLMSHSSGLYYGDIDKGARQGTSKGASRDARTNLEQFSKALAQEPLKFHPGTSYNYGHSIDVLGRYIEAVTGKPLDVVMQEKVLKPLKMNDTDFWVPPAKADRICQIYKQPRPGVLERGREASQLTEKPTLFLGGQGLCSTTEDYERFCLMLLNGGELDGRRILKSETVDMMFQNHLNDIGMKYGLGGAVDEKGGYSWGGANGTQFWIDRTNKLFAIFMVQTQLYRAPTYQTFRNLVNESAGVIGSRIGESDSGSESTPGDIGMTGLFKQRDKNGDRKLDRDEVPATLLNRLDKNQDGYVTADELIR